MTQQFDYWTTYARFQMGQLTPQERKRFRSVGVLAEAMARDKGTSYLPHSPEFDAYRAVPPQELGDEVAILLGITALALTKEVAR